ncbi:diguanylate cyclase domain-containing protein [Rossellomorea aquimaris]|uniref:diguanylate cyclase domain-containing protein n=1 Tax=Rossellomorea aquimaris TaxID=189382 RepID=UPI0012E70895
MEIKQIGNKFIKKPILVQLSGDEFIILINETENKTLTHFVENVLAVLSVPIKISEEKSLLSVSVSVDVSISINRNESIF